MSMNPNEYQKLASRTICPQELALDRIRNFPERNVQVLHSLIGLMGEVGELASMIEGHLWYNKEFDTVNLQEEVGDLLWYLAEGLSAIGVDMESVMLKNIEKLQVRYPEKYTDYRAANRNREAERESLESQNDCVIREQTGAGWAEPPEEREEKTLQPEPGTYALWRN